MTPADYINVWNNEVFYVTEVFSRDEILDALGYAPLAFGNTDGVSTESLAIELAHRRIGENNATRKIPAESMIREFLTR